MMQTGNIFEARHAPLRRVETRLGDVLAFAGVYLFTLLLYVRPNELFPGLFEAIPIVKIVALMTAAVYVASMINQGRPLTILPVELGMVIAIATLAIGIMPVAAAPQDTIDTLSDPFLKVLLVFGIMINILNTPERLRALMKLVLLCAGWLAASAIWSFIAGDVAESGRVEGAVGGTFGNPNDLATSMNLLVPVAVALALKSRGVLRLAYAGCAMLLALATLMTFSRGGFLGLMAASGVLLLKLQRGKSLMPWVTGVLVALVLVAPTPLGDRLFTIVTPSSDETGSAQERQMVLRRGILVAARHSVIGIGMGNFHIYSYHELKAHNSYLEMWAELGLIGLAAYMVLIIAPLRSLLRLELETAGKENERIREIHYLSIGLQATLAAYIVCSLFTSIQYQWFLYYPVAYVVALRGIHEHEKKEAAEAHLRSGLEGTVWAHPAGAFFRPKQPGTIEGLCAASQDS